MCIIDFKFSEIQQLFCFQGKQPPKKPAAYVHLYRAPGAHEHYLEDVDEWMFAPHLAYL